MELSITVRAEYALARLMGAAGRMRRNLMVAATRLSIELQRSVKQDKLTGQVLHVRTGTLRRSINREVFEREDGVFAIVGTNVDYARPHEFGFQGVVNVRAHVRYLRTPKGKKSENGIPVRAHFRRVDLPERSFLRSTLLEFTPRIREAFKAAALGALK